MALKSTAKSLATARVLKDNLQMRLAQAGVTLNTVRETQDAQGWGVLFVSVGGDEAAEQPVIAIRIRAIDAVSKTVLGGDLFAATPHRIEMAFDATAVTMLQVQAVQHEVDAMGMAVEVKNLTADAAVTTAAMDLAAPALVLDWVRYPNKLG